MGVAQVPRQLVAAEHVAVVKLCVRNDSRIDEGLRMATMSMSVCGIRVHASVSDRCMAHAVHCTVSLPSFNAALDH